MQRHRLSLHADVFSAYANILEPALGASLGMTAPYDCTALVNRINALSLPAPDAVPKYTDVQRIFNKGCIECHGGLGYPPYANFDMGTHLDFSEDEMPAAGDARMTRSWRNANGRAMSLAGPLFSRIISTSEACPFGMMPCGGPPLSQSDVQTIRRWIEGGAAYSEGDPHIRTIDHIAYDFQGAGEYVLLKGEGLEIQARHTAVPTAGPLGPNDYTGLTSCVSINTAVAVRMDTQRITYEPRLSGEPNPEGLELRIDGKLAKLGSAELRLASGGRIVRATASQGIQIESQGGTAIVVTPAWWPDQQVWHLDIDVRQTRATDGLMGALAPGTWLPALPDGRFMRPRPTDLGQRYSDLYDTFGNAWRVDDATTLFDYAPGFSTKSFIDEKWPNGESPQSCIPVQLPGGPVPKPPQRPIDRETAEKLCSAIADKGRRANCMQDVMVTGEAGFVQTYAATEAIERNRAPSPPILMSPADFATNLKASVAFSWRMASDVDKDKLTYRHCLWRVDQPFGFDKCDAKPLEGRGRLLRMSKTIRKLDAGRAYFWKVIAEDGRGRVAESETRRMTLK